MLRSYWYTVGYFLYQDGLGEDGDGDNDVKEVVPASEVETGGERRWKCRLCGLTFSRQAAVLNHFKLQVRREDSLKD